MSTSRPALLTLCLAAGLCSLPAAQANTVERKELGNLVTENIPAIPEAVSGRLEQYLNSRSAAFADWHPDGKGLLIATRFGETAQLHFVREPLGMRKQLTFFKEPVAGARYAPDGKGFLYQRDNGGDENYQIYYFDEATGRSRLETDGKSRNEGPVWAEQGSVFAYGSSKRNGKDTDLYLKTLGGAERLLLEVQGSYSPIEFSADGKTLLAGQYISVNESKLFLVDVASGKATQLLPDAGKVSYGTAAFSRDGKGLYYTSDAGREFQTLRYYELATGQSKPLSEQIPWDVADLALSDNGRYLAFVSNEDGITRLHLRDLKKGKAVKTPELPMGAIGGLKFSPDGARLALSLNTATSPTDVYVLDMKERELVRWTESEVGGLDTGRFVTPELVHFKSFDGRDIPAFVYQPKKPGPHPVVINIHGGPEGQILPTYSDMTQYFVNELGVAVITPNVRGSSGYGKTYLDLDNGFRREDSVKDIGALLDWIGSQKELDARRVMVMGGSYGGYMALASMTHYNERLRGGVDIVGISHFVTFLTNTKGYRQDLRRVEYGDERDPAMRAHLEKISPLNNANKITKPLFVVQGLNDPRVPVGEAEQIVQTVRGNGGDAWYLLAKDEGHGFKKKQNRDYYLASLALFLEQNLLR